MQQASVATTASERITAERLAETVSTFKTFFTLKCPSEVAFAFH